VPSELRRAAPVSASGPYILALDAAGSACSVAVAAADTLLSVRSRPIATGQAEALLPMVDAAMQEAALPVSALDLVAATVGPGSFTGVRVGLAAARGIALAAALPLLGITGFEAVSACLDGKRGACGALLLAALESRRAELYVQLFGSDRPLGEPAAILPDALADWVAAGCGALPLVVAGDAVQRAVAALGARPRTTASEDGTAAVVGVAREALKRWRRGERHGRVAPLYLRAPDVTLPRGAAARSS
jgi:tRNA threonylcarbamoyladenosine biosynthesis protein TsaB